MAMLIPDTRRSLESGFTLLELMAAIAVLGVLLAIGVPSFTEIIRNNRTAAQATELTTALSLARSEAAKRGLPITICAADNAQTGCADAAAADWANGWLIFQDEGSTPGAVDVGERILQTSRKVTAGLQLTTNAVGFVRFGSNGAPTNSAAIAIGTAAVSFGLQHVDCTGTNRRNIVVDRTGRVNLTKVACT